MNFKYNITSNYQIFFNHAGSCQMEGIVSLYNYIMTYLVGILFVVTTALVFIVVTHLHGNRHVKQFKNEKDLNELIYWMKFLQKWTHSTLLELIWTIIPTIILIAIAVPSFILLYSLDEIVDTQCVVKIIAYQWYWKYEYPVYDIQADDVINFSYLSYMLPLENLTEENNLRLLEVDTPLVLPINVNSKLVITAKDVIHSFAVPALGIKMDAVPGRLNQVTVHIFKPGVYYGQCSELCGVNHAFMPIVVNAVHFNTFESFLLTAVESAGHPIRIVNPANLPLPSPSPDDDLNAYEAEVARLIQNISNVEIIKKYLSIVESGDEEALKAFFSNPADCEEFAYQLSFNESLNADLDALEKLTSSKS